MSITPGGTSRTYALPTSASNPICTRAREGPLSCLRPCSKQLDGSAAKSCRIDTGWKQRSLVIQHLRLSSISLHSTLCTAQHTKHRTAHLQLSSMSLHSTLCYTRRTANRHPVQVASQAANTASRPGPGGWKDCTTNLEHQEITTKDDVHSLY